MLMLLFMQEQIHSKKLQVTTTFFARMLGQETIDSYKRKRLNLLADDGFLDKKKIRSRIIYSLTESARYMCADFAVSAYRSASDIELQLHLWDAIDKLHSERTRAS